ncbi:hypothetical protein Q5P01_022927 [Channa striata]|uniref:Interleukin-20 receptor subunit beta-like n=1 Tax=Channa striata TaxID=64152 RepID=A0AA88RWK3_CHASR|nr:hypothetical protein Q5P01_022927 [Channa striata]
MNSVVMRLQQTLRLMVLFDFITGVRTIPAPSSVTVDSVDLRHTLTWSPLQAQCNTTILYSVQFQGEFELLVRNGSWVDAPDCQQVPHTHCDLTFDLGSDSDYNLHVRARCGSELSAWSELDRPFNRRDTVLTVPNMTVTVVGGALLLSFLKLPLTAAASVTLWRKGHELQASVYTVPAEQKLLHVSDLQAGAEYCVTAQTVLNTQLRSSSTDVHCVSITSADPDAAWKKPTTVTGTVIIMAGLLFAVFWSIVHCRPDRCQTHFHKEPLPQSLQHVQDIQILMSPPEEQEELCEQVHMVPRADLQPRATQTDAAFPEDQRAERPFSEDFREHVHVSRSC